MRKRSKQNLSHYKLFSANQGYLYPIGAPIEVLPGDTFRHSTSAFIRVSPLVTPVMHPVHVSVHHWYVPTRLIWEDWEDFITGGPDGTNTSTPPYITINDLAVGSLGDYFGLPTGVASDRNVSALPFRAYNLIYNEWYRDQDLQNELAISLASGQDTTTSTSLQKSNWEKDYFTTCRSSTQKGPDITIPLGDTAPVYGAGTTGASTVNASNFNLWDWAPAAGIAGDPDKRFGRIETHLGNPQLETIDNDGLTQSSLQGLSLGTKEQYENWNGSGDAIPPYADLSGSIAPTINQLRLAFGLQKFEEMRARYGSRYVEYLMADFGVRSPDARLQRPEYLGGGKQTIQFSEVLQTAEGTDPVGSLKGHGIAAMNSNAYRKFFTEHGYVLSFIRVLPKTMYTQGLHKMWFRETKEDFFNPHLQHIGQAEVYNKEVYAGHSTPDGVFGYQDRYDEYRRIPSTVSGEFRTTLNDWHMARIFNSDPALNSSFVEANPTDRIYASTTTDELYIMARQKLIAHRPIAKTGNPRITL